MNLPKRVSVLSLAFDPLTWDESLARFAALFTLPGQHQVVKANAEFAVSAARDPAVATIINNASLVLADGAGIVWAAEALGRRGFGARFFFGLASFISALFGRRLPTGPIPERVGGSDHVVAECREAAKLGKSVFLIDVHDDAEQFGARPGAAAKLTATIPGLKIAGTAGSRHPFEEADRLVAAVNQSGAAFLIVCFGHPAQERWIAENLPKMPAVKVADGEGGALDFIAGIQKRAPLFVQRIGFEGFWRILTHPVKRLRKAWVTYPVFIWKVLIARNS